jgi:quinol monooxygenase YgiN
MPLRPEARPASHAPREEPMNKASLLPRSLPLVGLLLTVPAASAGDDHPVVAMVKSKVKDPSKPLALLVTIKARASKGKELEAAFAPCIAATKKEPGCLAYELNRDPDEPTSYLMYEKFKSVKALADHLALEHTQRLLKAVGPLTDGEIKAKVYAVPD